MDGKQEVLEGYVVDVACLRKYPLDELLGRAQRHTRACALMAHCIESGYGLVGEDGGLALLDANATVMVVEALRSIYLEKGVRLRITREAKGESMETVRVAPI